jgi:Mg2+/Co2+ transporter CorB
MTLELWLSILPIAVLLLMSAFFSMSETAMTAASVPRMTELASQQNRRAALVLKLRASRERMIGALLLGNNLVNILASTLTAGLFIAAFGEAGVFYATAVATALILVFSEVLPKTYALYRPNRTALAVAPVIRVLVFALAPVVAAVETLVRGLLRAAGVRPSAPGGAAIEQELRGAIRLHRGDDPEIRDERRMLSGVLDLGDATIGEIMTHRSNVVAIDADTPPAQVLRQVLATAFSRFPVYRGNPENIVGVLHAKDLLRAAYRARTEGEPLDLARLMTPVWFVPESTSQLDQLRAFQRRREHMAIVVDEYGAYQGVVALEDILEEIVGDISDEYDLGAAGIRPAGEGAWVVNGDVTVRDLNRQLDWSLPDEPAATVAGLVMHEARRIPEVKQVFAFHGVRFEILRKRGHRIAMLKVSRLDAGAAPVATTGEGEPPPADPAKN